MHQWICVRLKQDKGKRCPFLHKICTFTALVKKCTGSPLCNSDLFHADYPQILPLNNACFFPRATSSRLPCRRGRSEERVFRSADQPTDPSICNEISLFISTAYSRGVLDNRFNKSIDNHRLRLFFRKSPAFEVKHLFVSTL